MNKNIGQNGVFSLFKGVPLRRILVALFVLQILLAVGLTAYLSIRNGQKAVNEVTSELRYEVANRVEQNLQAYLSTPRQVLRGNQNVIDIGLLKMENLAATWESYLIKQLEIFPDAVALTASNEQQEPLAVEKLNDRQYYSEKLISQLVTTSTPTKLTFLVNDTQLPEVIKTMMRDRVLTIK